MAAKKKAAGKEKASLTVSSAAWKHGREAYGARYIQEGFGFDPQEDLEWALGWPHVRRLIDGHPDDKNAIARWVKSNMVFPHLRTDLPREAAARYVRRYKFRPKTPAEWREGDLARPYMDVEGPITDEEARSIIRLQLAPGSEFLWWVFRFPEMLLWMEAFVGPVPVAEALVEAIEGWPIELLTVEEESKTCDCIEVLGFLLLRVPEATHDALEKRLRKVLDAAVATLPRGLAPVVGDFHHDDGEPYFLAYRTLDRVLNGKAGALRMAGKTTLTDLLFVHDAPELLAEWMQKRISVGPGDELSLPRLAFLGGESMLDFDARWWKKYHEPDPIEAKRLFVLHYGRIRSKKMLPIFLAMSQSPKVAKEVAAWFAAHPEHTRPYLERAAKGSGDEAKWAKALLA